MTQRFRLTYSGTCNAYDLNDEETGKIVFQSLRKSEVIAESQKRNGFTPINGDEQTYAKQTGRS